MCNKKDFELSTGRDAEPLQFWKDRGDVFSGAGVSELVWVSRCEWAGGQRGSECIIVKEWMRPFLFWWGRDDLSRRRMSCCNRWPGQRGHQRAEEVRQTDSGWERAEGVMNLRQGFWSSVFYVLLVWSCCLISQNAFKKENTPSQK